LLMLQIQGCAVLGIGVWMLVKEWNTREMAAIMGSPILEWITYGLIAGGGAATILAFCGCCGTMRQERFVMGFVRTFLCFILKLNTGTVCIYIRDICTLYKSIVFCLAYIILVRFVFYISSMFLICKHDNGNVCILYSTFEL